MQQEMTIAEAKRSVNQADSARPAAALVHQLIDGNPALMSMCRELGFSEDELAQFAFDETSMRAVRHLALLADAQARLLVSACRVSAAARLVSMATGEGGGETARKACVDLLTLQLRDLDEALAEADVVGRTAHSPAAPTAEQILRTLESLGEQWDAAHAEIGESHAAP